jgi:hypothetical protein
VARASKVRGVRLPAEVDEWLVGWAGERGVSVSEALRLAVVALMAEVEGPRRAARRAASVSSLPSRREPVPVSRAELFAGLRVPVSVRGQRVGERPSGG